MQEDILYKPSVFWENACQKLEKYILEKGLEDFRNNELCTYFFVPTYGVPGNGLNKESIEELITCLKNGSSNSPKNLLLLEKSFNGYLSALADYRVLLASDNPKEKPYLHHFSESNFGKPVEQFNFENKYYSRSALNYLLGMSFLKKNLNGFIPKNIVEIGGGFGTLGEILFHSGIDNFKYVNFDIYPMNLFSNGYLKQVVGSENVTEDSLLTSPCDFDQLKKITCTESFKIEHLNGQIDLFVNFISFQEMEPAIVKNYLKHVDRLEAKYILLRNLKEGKQKKIKETDIGVNDPVKEQDYIDYLSNYSLVEINVHPFGYNTIDGFNSQLMLFKRK